METRRRRTYDDIDIVKKPRPSSSSSQSSSLNSARQTAKGRPANRKPAKRRRRRSYITRRLILWLTLFAIVIFAVNTLKKKTTEAKVEEPPVVEEKNLESQIDFSKISPELKALRKKYPDVDKILVNIDSYPEDIINLLIRNPETMDFVANYPQSINKTTSSISIASDYEEGSIPHFLQWDKRWGYEKYGESVMGLSGCGPTSLAMVVAGLTGDLNANPLEIAEYSIKNGYVEANDSTSWTLFTQGAKEFGVTGTMLPLGENNIKNALVEKKPIIASMGPGDFTSTGHIIVLVGLDSDGNIIVNDPNSRIKSNKKWHPDVFLTQAKNLWVYEKS